MEGNRFGYFGPRRLYRAIVVRPPIGRPRRRVYRALLYFRSIRQQTHRAS